MRFAGSVFRDPRQKCRRRRAPRVFRAARARICEAQKRLRIRHSSGGALWPRTSRSTRSLVLSAEKRRRHERGGLSGTARSRPPLSTKRGARWRSLHELAFDLQLAAEPEHGWSGAETLRAELQQMAVAPLAADDAAGPREASTRCASIPALRNAYAHTRPDIPPPITSAGSMRGHGKDAGLNTLQSFRKQRLGVQVLFFQVRIKNHRQIANENSASQVARTSLLSTRTRPSSRGASSWLSSAAK